MRKSQSGQGSQEIKEISVTSGLGVLYRDLVQQFIYLNRSNALCLLAANHMLVSY
jgi:hypothetical protein